MTTPGAGDERRRVGRPAVTGARLVRNTFVNALGIGSGMVITIVLTPFMLDRLGASMFGVWALALTLTISAGYLTLTDLGLQQAAVRFMADARRKGDDDAIAGIFSATLFIFVGIAVPVGALLVAASPAIAGLFSLHGAERHAAVVSFAIVGGQIVFDLPSLAFRSVLESDQRFVAIRAIELTRAIVFAGLTVAVLLSGRGVVAVAASSAVASAAALAGYVVVVLTSEPAAKIRSAAIGRTQFRALFQFSGALFLLRILSVVYRQMDKVIIGVVLSVTAVATYEVANRIQAALILTTSFAGGALLPAAALSRLDKGRMRDLFLRATSYSVALFLPLAIAVFIYARLLIVAWVGTSQIGATGATRLFALWIGLGTLDAAGSTMLVASGRLKPIVILSALWVSANLVLSLVLVHVWGIAGVVAGTVISYTPLLVAYTTLCLKEYEIKLSDWARRVVRPNLLGAAVQVVLCFATLHQIERLPPRIGVLLGGAAGTAVSLSIYFFVGIPPEERNYLRRVMSGAAARTAPDSQA